MTGESNSDSAEKVFILAHPIKKSTYLWSKVLATFTITSTLTLFIILMWVINASCIRPYSFNKGSPLRMGMFIEPNAWIQEFTGARNEINAENFGTYKTAFNPISGLLVEFTGTATDKRDIYNMNLWTIIDLTDESAAFYSSAYYGLCMLPTKISDDYFGLGIYLFFWIATFGGDFGTIYRSYLKKQNIFYVSNDRCFDAIFTILNTKCIYF
jgi:hypothetical protein